MMYDMAQNIWDDACKNTLQQNGRIDRYLKDDPNCIDKVGGQESLTPLAGAAYHGHLEVVTLLLEKGARPNAPCPHGRTALFFVLKQAPRNQHPIVKALLQAGADPNEVYPEDDNVNALTIAIEESQDKDLVRTLMGAGAKPTEGNQKEARAKKMEPSLQPWKGIVGSPVNRDPDGDVVSATTSGDLGKTDKITNPQSKPVAVDIPEPKSAKDFEKNIGNCVQTAGLENFFGKRPEFLQALAEKASVLRNDTTTDLTNLFFPQSKPVAVDIPEPKSAKDFEKNIGNFVQTAGLENFFGKRPEFLQALAEKASVLRNDTTTDLGKPENLQRLTNLSLYQLVIYCDDSGSMGYDRDIPGQKKTRYRSQCELVSRITNVATKLLPDDSVVKLRFINNPFDRDVTVSGVDRVMEGGFHGGSTPLGTQLVKKIIQPLVYDKIFNPAFVFEQPLLICTITDGTPDSGDIPIKQVVSDCRTALVGKQYDSTSVMFCISQIGTNSSAKAFLDSLRNDNTIKDVVYCTTDQLDVKFAELRDQERLLEVWLLDVLTKPIMRKRS